MLGGIACLLMGIGSFFIPSVLHIGDKRADVLEEQPAGWRPGQIEAGDVA